MEITAVITVDDELVEVALEEYLADQKQEHVVEINDDVLSALRLSFG